jgi:hypothetical protein
MEEKKLTWDKIVHATLVAQIAVCRSEREALIHVFGGYATDRLRVLERQIPLMEEVANQWKAKYEN